MGVAGLARSGDLDARAQSWAQTMANDIGGGSVLPMGSLFEQALLLYLDSLVVALMDRLGITAEQMERVHFNLP